MSEKGKVIELFPRAREEKPTVEEAYARGLSTLEVLTMIMSGELRPNEPGTPLGNKNEYLSRPRRVENGTKTGMDITSIRAIEAKAVEMVIGGDKKKDDHQDK